MATGLQAGLQPIELLCGPALELVPPKLHAGPEAGAVALLLYKRAAQQGDHAALLSIGDSYWWGQHGPASISGGGVVLGTADRPLPLRQQQRLTRLLMPPHVLQVRQGSAPRLAPRRQGATCERVALPRLCTACQVKLLVFQICYYSLPLARNHSTSGELWVQMYNEASNHRSAQALFNLGLMHQVCVCVCVEGCTKRSTT